MPLQATSGAASYDAFGGGVPVVPNYIESVFQTWLYTGNGSTQTITNGIDLSTKGGLVWCKARTGGTVDHALSDTARGRASYLISNSTAAAGTVGAGDNITSFNTNGFSLGTDNGTNFNLADEKMASWTFRKQPKFFDIVTYTGNATAGRTIAHNLGAVPGCIIVKQTGGGGSGGVNNWFVYHRSLGGTKYLALDSTIAAVTSSSTWNNTDPTSTVFTIGGTSDCNDSGGTYVAYLFAHDAGGFGLSGTDNVISCGSFTANGSGYATVNLGYEPQFLITKVVSAAGYSWRLLDTMRGWSQSGNDMFLTPNSSSAEGGDGFGTPTATGFEYGQTGANTQHIYIAIRRGPMKVPTTGTSVFSPTTYAGNSSATRLVDTGINLDMHILGNLSDPDFFVLTRLIGTPCLRTRSASAETSSAGTNGIPTILTSENNKFGFTAGSTNLAKVNATGSNYVDWAFARAPNFMDVVCYTGNSTARTLTHNLTVAPELMLVKQRSGSEVWSVYYGDNTDFLVLNSDNATADSNIYWNDTSPTASVFTVGTGNEVNNSGSTYVAYLFATLAGVSKVGSYTGTATTLQIDCGFTSGARFVLIKRTDSTGAWYVWDSARGIVAGNDPYLLLNSSAAEVTNTDYIDTYSAGFEISSTAPAAINASGGSFIFLAIA